MHDVIGGVGMAEIGEPQVGACRVVAFVGDGHVLRRQHLAGDDLAFPIAHDAREGVAVEHERCHDVGDEITAGTGDVRLQHHGAHVRQVTAAALFHDRQAGDGGLEHLHATEHG